MSRLFLGRASHWAALAVIAAVLWLVGEERFHVTHFNWFVALVLVLALGALALVVFGYRPGDRVMREPPEGPAENGQGGDGRGEGGEEGAR